MAFFNRRTPPDEAPNEPPPAAEDEAQAAGQATLPRETRHAATRIFDTALGAGSVLEGTLSSDGNVRLDGKFKGALDIKENVLVGITAEIEANIAAANVSVAGVVRGDVSGKKVHLLATARIWGNITAEALITEDGAFIEGRVSIGRGEPEDAVSEADLAGPDDDDMNAGDPL